MERKEKAELLISVGRKLREVGISKGMWLTKGAVRKAPRMVKARSSRESQLVLRPRKKRHALRG